MTKLWKVFVSFILKQVYGYRYMYSMNFENRIFIQECQWLQWLLQKTAKDKIKFVSWCGWPKKYYIALFPHGTITVGSVEYISGSYIELTQLTSSKWSVSISFRALLVSYDSTTKTLTLWNLFITFCLLWWKFI